MSCQAAFTLPPLSKAAFRVQGGILKTLICAQFCQIPTNGSTDLSLLSMSAIDTARIQECWFSLIVFSLLGLPFRLLSFLSTAGDHCSAGLEGADGLACRVEWAAEVRQSTDEYGMDQ